jgi:hypothetical protein
MAAYITLLADEDVESQLQDNCMQATTLSGQGEDQDTPVQAMTADTEDPQQAGPLEDAWERFRHVSLYQQRVIQVPCSATRFPLCQSVYGPKLLWLSTHLFQVRSGSHEQRICSEHTCHCRLCLQVMTTASNDQEVPGDEASTSTSVTGGYLSAGVGMFWYGTLLPCRICQDNTMMACCTRTPNANVVGH